jgi:hypothetical protein
MPPLEIRAGMQEVRSKKPEAGGRKQREVRNKKTKKPLTE